MTQTIQPRSWALLNNAGKDLTKNKGGIKDDIRLMRSALDDLKNLYRELSRLCDIIVRANIEISVYRQNKGGAK